MLLKKLPDYFDSPNPVKVALTIVKAIIEIKDVGRSSMYLEHTLTIISGDRRQQGRAYTTSRRNGEWTPGCGEDYSYRCSQGCRTGDEETRTVRCPPCAKWYIMMNKSPSRILREEMKKLQDLARESLDIQTVDYEEYKRKIGQIFQRMKGATRSFQVHALIFI